MTTEPIPSSRLKALIETVYGENFLVTFWVIAVLEVVVYQLVGRLALTLVAAPAGLISLAAYIWLYQLEKHTNSGWSLRERRFLIVVAMVAMVAVTFGVLPFLWL